MCFSWFSPKFHQISHLKSACHHPFRWKKMGFPTWRELCNNLRPRFISWGNPVESTRAVKQMMFTNVYHFWPTPVRFYGTLCQDGLWMSLLAQNELHKMMQLLVLSHCASWVTATHGAPEALFALRKRSLSPMVRGARSLHSLSSIDSWKKAWKRKKKIEIWLVVLTPWKTISQVVLDHPPKWGGKHRIFETTKDLPWIYGKVTRSALSSVLQNCDISIFSLKELSALRAASRQLSGTVSKWILISFSLQ